MIFSLLTRTKKVVESTGKLGKSISFLFNLKLNQLNWPRPLKCPESKGTYVSKELCLDSLGLKGKDTNFTVSSDYLLSLVSE